MTRHRQTLDRIVKAPAEVTTSEPAVPARRHEVEAVPEPVRAARSAAGGALVVLLCVAAGCATSGSSHTVVTATTDDVESSPSDVVCTYVNDLAHGRVTAALALRGSQLKLKASDRKLFTAQLGQLQQAAGPITGVTDVRQTRTDVPIGSSTHGVEVAYRVRFGQRTTGEQKAGLSKVNGTWRLQGFTTPQATGVGAAAARTMQLRPATSLQPHDITSAMPTPAHATPDADMATRPTARDAPGLGPGWTRAWLVESHGGVRITAARYDTPAHALAGTRTHLLRNAGDDTQSFPIPAVPGAVGVRIRTFAYLGVQPADIGPYLDQITAVHGTLAFTIQWAYAPGKDHRTELFALIHQLETTIQKHP